MLDRAVQKGIPQCIYRRHAVRDPYPVGVADLRRHSVKLYENDLLLTI